MATLPQRDSSVKGSDMSIDHELQKAVLLYAREHVHERHVQPPTLEGYTEVQVHYHVRMCHEAGYMDATEVSSHSHQGKRYLMGPLTYAGQAKLQEMMGEPEL